MLLQRWYLFYFEPCKTRNSPFVPKAWLPSTKPSRVYAISGTHYYYGETFHSDGNKILCINIGEYVAFGSLVGADFYGPNSSMDAIPALVIVALELELSNGGCRTGVRRGGYQSPCNPQD